MKCKDNNWIYISVHVDDLIVTSSQKSLIADFESEMNAVFTMKNLGNLKYYLGLQFERNSDGTFSVHQKAYIEKKLREFNLQDSKASTIPLDPGYQKRQEILVPFNNKDIYRKGIGSLQYLACHTRPDIAAAASILAQKVENPSTADWTELKRIFRYLKHTKELMLKLGDKQASDN